MEKITFNSESYLSNKFHAPALIDGEEWPTVSHFLLEKKFKHIEQVRGDWESDRLMHLWHAIQAKFDQYPEFIKALQATGSAVLLKEGSVRNVLGKELMDLRTHYNQMDVFGTALRGVKNKSLEEVRSLIKDLATLDKVPSAEQYNQFLMVMAAFGVRSDQNALGEMFIKQPSDSQTDCYFRWKHATQADCILKGPDFFERFLSFFSGPITGRSEPGTLIQEEYALNGFACVAETIVCSYCSTTVPSELARYSEIAACHCLRNPDCPFLEQLQYFEYLSFTAFKVRF